MATDAALATPPTASLEAPVRVLRVGRDAANQAIVALAVRTAPSGLSHSAFVSVANLGLELADRQLQLFADGRLRDSRTVHLDPQRRTDVSIDDIDDAQHPASVVEVRLVDAEGTRPPRPPTRSASTTGPGPSCHPSRSARCCWPGEPDPYLETALSFLPDTELYFRDGKDWSTLTGLDEYELIIFNRFLPDKLPARPILAIAPPSTSALGTPAGTLQNPGIGTIDPSDPVLRYVDLSTVHVAESAKLDLPAWARSVIPGPGGSPLLYSGSLDGRPAAVMAFEPRHSDLPLQVAFPVLLANLSGELMGGSDAPLDAVAPGAPVTLPVPEGSLGVRVERPDGTADELVAPTKGAASVTFARTDLLGVYTVSAIPDPDASAAPSGGASPGAASPGASSGAGAIGPPRRIRGADVPAARGRGAEPVRCRPPGRRRVRDRPRRPRKADRAGRRRPAGRGPARVRRSSARTRATSCGSRSCCSPWSCSRSSGSSTSATRSRGCGRAVAARLGRRPRATGRSA